MCKVKCVWDAGATLGKGAVWHPDEQALYWIDNFESKLHRYGLDGEKSSWTFPGGISSVVPAKVGGLLATFRHGVSHIDTGQNHVTPLLQLESDLPDNRLNDGCCDMWGNYWFGSMDTTFQDRSGGFYKLTEDGVSEKISELGEFCITNGPTFSADGRWIYYTDTGEGKIFRARIESDGRLRVPELHIQFSPEEGYPDGMCTDAEDGLWVCLWAGHRVIRFHSDGSKDTTIEVPAPNVSKCAFGGPKMRTLFITTATSTMTDEQFHHFPQAGGLFSIDVDYQGFSFPAAVYRTDIGQE